MGLLAGSLVGSTPAANAAIPAPTATTSVIAVKVGGDRVGTGITDTGAVVATPLQGAVLGLYATETATNPVNTTWAVCTSDAAGDCSFVVPDTQLGGANRDRRFWVKQISAPSGWFMNTTLRTGIATTPATPSYAQNYAFLTQAQLRASTTYSSLSNFMYAPATTANFENWAASSGVWQQSRNNPALLPQCGLDIALILDLSGSMTRFPGQPLGAANAVIDAFEGTPTRLAFFTYGSSSPAVNQGGPPARAGNLPTLMPISTAAGAQAVRDSIAGWGPYNGNATNWDHGLYTTAVAAPTYDLAIHITDGNPVLYGDPRPAIATGANTRLKEVEYAIYSANRLKSEGTRIVSVGVGPDISAYGHFNLAATSGPVAYNGSNSLTADYFLADDFDDVVQQLTALATANCTGSISVVKQIVPEGNTGEDVTGATAAPAGWEFSGSTTTTGIGGLPATRTTTGDGTGAVNFPLTFPPGGAPASVNISEAQQPGYQIVTQGGQNATCTDTVTGTAVAVVNDNSDPDNPGFVVDASAPQTISCVVYNKIVPDVPADLTVEKSWVVDGETYADGAQPDGVSAQLQLTGPGSAGATDQDWGQTRTGYLRDDIATMSEITDLTGDYAHCTVEGVVTEVNGAATSTALPASGFDVTLTEEHNTAEITNTVVCEQSLTLVKEVSYGSEAPSAWTLSATVAGPGVAGPTGTHSDSTPVSGSVTGGASYELAEDGGPDTYVGLGWTCVLDDDGADVETIDGFLVMPRGQDVTCTVVNATSTITVLKHVIDPEPGFEADAWELTATPDDLPGGSLSAATVTGAETEVAGANTIEVRPEHGYTLTETSTSPLMAYRQVGLERYDGTTWIAVDSADIIAPAPGEYALYRFVNEHIDGVTLPLTGGASTDAFVIGGAALALLSVIGGVVAARRRRMTSV